MTVDTKNISQNLEPWLAEDEIDLRRYIDILIRWWREISTITLAFILFSVIGIALMRLVLSPRYAASSDVAIVRTSSDVNFDERFRTIAEELGQSVPSLNARRSALVGLVTTGAIAQEVIGQLGDMLSETEKNPATLIEMVSAETVSSAGTSADSDLLRINVVADTPEKAAAIANAWAYTYVSQINSIYGQVPNEVMASIQAELENAKQNYLSSQTTLENFIAQSPLDALTSEVTILQQRVTQESTLQQAFLLQWQQAQEQLTLARALEKQIELGGEGAVRSAMAALQVLKLSAYGMPPEQLQIEVRDLPEVSQDLMLADLKALTESLESKLQELNNQIPSEENGQEGNKRLQTPAIIIQQLQGSKAKLEAETAVFRQLTQKRDIDWETYKTLSNKVAELKLARAAASSEVRFGAPAVPPTKSNPRVSLFMGPLISGLVGILSALLYVAIAEYLGKNPFLTKQNV